jgi:hypothetical protein
VWLEGLGKLKPIHLIRTRTCDLACSIVPQPTTLPCALLADCRMYSIQYSGIAKLFSLYLHTVGILFVAFPENTYKQQEFQVCKITAFLYISVRTLLLGY